MRLGVTKPVAASFHHRAVTAADHPLTHRSCGPLATAPDAVHAHSLGVRYTLRVNRYNVDTVYLALDRIQSRYKPRYRELEVSCDTAVSDSFATRARTTCCRLCCGAKLVHLWPNPSSAQNYHEACDG